MQKVEGSSPFSRSQKAPSPRGFRRSKEAIARRDVPVCVACCAGVVRDPYAEPGGPVSQAMRGALGTRTRHRPPAGPCSPTARPGATARPTPPASFRILVASKTKTGSSSTGSTDRVTARSSPDRTETRGPKHDFGISLPTVSGPSECAFRQRGMESVFDARNSRSSPRQRLRWRWQPLSLSGS
jgi:hypothetical protein